jgi:hypothetical protein
LVGITKIGSTSSIGELLFQCFCEGHPLLGIPARGRSRQPAALFRLTGLAR